MSSTTQVSNLFNSRFRAQSRAACGRNAFGIRHFVSSARFLVRPARRTIRRRAIGPLVDRLAIVAVSPATNAVEIFEAKAQRIHAIVARCIPAFGDADRASLRRNGSPAVDSVYSLQEPEHSAEEPAFLQLIPELLPESSDLGAPDLFGEDTTLTSAHFPTSPHHLDDHPPVQLFATNFPHADQSDNAERGDHSQAHNRPPPDPLLVVSTGRQVTATSRMASSRSVRLRPGHQRTPGPSLHHPDELPEVLATQPLQSEVFSQSQ